MFRETICNFLLSISVEFLKFTIILKIKWSYGYMVIWFSVSANIDFNLQLTNHLSHIAI